MDFVSKRIKEVVARGSPSSVRIYLWVSSHLLRLTPAYKTRRLVTDMRILLEYKAGRLTAAENVIYEFCQYQSPSTWAITSYISRVVNSGVECRLDDIIASKHIRSDLLPLLVSAHKRREGDLEGALKSLQYRSESYVIRNKIAHARRSIFHQSQSHEELADDGLRFLLDEPNELLIPFAVAVAGSAETAGRDDILCVALKRLIGDRDRIAQRRKLLRRYWKDAIVASLTVFDVDGAIEVARLAREAGIRKAGDRLMELLELKAEIHEWDDVVRDAYNYMRGKAFGYAEPNETVDAILVVPAAAFRSNPIDYPGFRRELRFVVKTIAEALTSSQVNFVVRGRIRTHGELGFDVPSFSYHTVSTGHKALHFKETDRPSRFSFDKGGYAGWSNFASKRIGQLGLSDVDYEKALAFFRAEQSTIIGGNVSKYAQLDRQTNANLPAKFVFVGLQVLGDAVQALAYADAFVMMDEVIATCLAQGISVVVKRHPQDKSGQISSYLRKRELSGEVIVSTSSIHYLIEQSQAVCVINSGVGAEALLHEKPVYVFGGCEYMNACFVCREAGDFARQFRPGVSRLSLDHLHRFWWVLRNQYAVDLNDREESRKWINERVSRHLLEMDADRSLSSMRQADNTQVG